MNIKTLIVATVFILLTFPALANEALDKIHQNIIRKHTDVAHISAAEYTKLAKDDIVVFDVRKPSEYAVSHLANATRVNPNISADDFFAKFGNELKGKKAVFYCSVGRRSSNLIDRLEQHNDSFDLVNLEGGIFRWTNETRTVNGNGVHPYNWYWSRLIEDKQQIHYSPVKQQPAKN